MNRSLPRGFRSRDLWLRLPVIGMVGNRTRARQIVPDHCATYPPLLPVNLCH